MKSCGVDILGMPKMKTHKATAKRFTITRKNKFLVRKAGQDHFNARESGKTTRNKRRDIQFSQSFKKTLDVALPNR